MTYAYLRVSTQIQDLEGQEFGVKEYCKYNDLKIDVWYEEKITGTKKYNDRKLGELMNQLHEGDILVTTEISRIGRKMTDVLRFIEKCREKGVTLHAIKQGFVLDDSLNAKIMAYTFAICAEIERELCSQRIKEKLAMKKARGEKLGKPFGSKNKHSKLEPQRKFIEEMLEKGITRYKLRKLLKTHAHTLNSFLLESGLAEKYNIEMTDNFKDHGARMSRTIEVPDEYKGTKYDAQTKRLNKEKDKKQCK